MLLKVPLIALLRRLATHFRDFWGTGINFDPRPPFDRGLRFDAFLSHFRAFLEALTKKLSLFVPRIDIYEVVLCCGNNFEEVVDVSRVIVYIVVVLTLLTTNEDNPMNIYLGLDNAKTREILKRLGINYNVVLDGQMKKLYVDERGAVLYLRSAA